MKRVPMFLAFFAGILIICAPAFAHHGATTYDMSEPLVMKDAVVTAVKWINPHILIQFDYKNDQDKTHKDAAVEHWTVEMGSPFSAEYLGWNRSTLNPGDTVTIYVWKSKSGATVGRLNKVVLANGTVMRDTQTGADNGDQSDAKALGRSVPH